jgi:hypothetical protein
VTVNRPSGVLAEACVETQFRSYHLPPAEGKPAKVAVTSGLLIVCMIVLADCYILHSDVSEAQHVPVTLIHRIWAIAVAVLHGERQQFSERQFAFYGC